LGAAGFKPLTDFAATYTPAMLNSSTAFCELIKHLQVKIKTMMPSPFAIKLPNTSAKAFKFSGSARKPNGMLYFRQKFLAHHNLRFC